MAEKMRVLLVEQMEEPKLVEIEHTLENLQKLVGGYIQSIYPWADPVALVCNDEAKIIGMPANRLLEDYDLICGPFFICGLTTDDFGSLSDEMARKYMEKFRHPEIFMRTDRGIMVIKVGSGKPPREIRFR